MILVNFKIYKETFGEGAIKLAEICKRVMEKTKVVIIPVVSALDVYRIKKEVGIKVYIQAVSEYEDGAKTGFISVKAAKEAGADGALINHSEQRVKPGTIKKMLANWPEGFESVVCLQTIGQVEGWAKNIKPTMIAYEPKYLIGNREKSVATEKPEIIKKIAEKYGVIPTLAGAGVHSKEDVLVALKMGAKGILVATDVVKADDQEKELSELANGFIMV